MTFREMVALENALNERRSAIEAAQDKILGEEPLTEAEKFAVWQIITDVIHGHDARQLVGIAPRGGPRPYSEHPIFIIGVHYWVLQVGKNAMLAKQAAAEVSLHWGVPAPRVQKMARQVRSNAEMMLATQPHADILKWIESCTPARMSELLRTPILGE
jgi:hypothetical protein